MAMYLADVLGEEEYFVCCRCGKKHHAMEEGMTLDDVYFEWDFDTDKEYLWIVTGKQNILLLPIHQLDT